MINYVINSIFTVFFTWIRRNNYKSNVIFIFMTNKRRYC
nr:MAG TPA: hypothetical protein [Caudoviricetes sp.]